jgi:signal transduction histidine kinase
MPRMAARPIRSLKIPILVGVPAVGLGVTLLVLWILAIVRDPLLTQEVAGNNVLLVGGVVSLLVMSIVLAMFSYFLAREIREGQRQDGFIDSVTHELKSPLASLKLAVQTLSRRELAPEQRAELLDMMLGDIDRLNTFIDDILAASRIGHGSGDLLLEWVELGGMAERLRQRVCLRHRVPIDAIEISVDTGARMLTSVASVETVLINLLDNAIKYSNPPPRVSLTVVSMPSTERLRFTVVDRGIGIPAEQLSRIFERFYRSPSEDVRSRRGTGLGLYVASSLVQEVAESAGSGQGTVMRFDVPMRHPAASPALRVPRIGEGS